MAADFNSTLLGLLMQGTGNNDNSWGDNLNKFVFAYLESAIAGLVGITVDGGSDNLSAANHRNMMLEFDGILAADQTIVIDNTYKMWLVNNITTGAFELKFKTASGAAIVIPQGGWCILWCDGDDTVHVGTSTAEFANLIARQSNYRADTSGSLTTGGSSTAYTITTNQDFDSLSDLDGEKIIVVPHVTSGAGPTLSVDGLTAEPMRFAAGTVPETGAFRAGTPYAFTYSNTNNEYLAHGLPAVFPANSIKTETLLDKSVSLRKLFHPTGPAKLLGSNSISALTITGAANNGSGLIRLTVGSTATFSTGQKKIVADVQGTTEANGPWTITVVDSTHIDLQGSAFANAYVSGGTIGASLEEITLGTGLAMSGNVLSAMPPGYLYGLTIANNTGDATNDIDIRTGKCRDDLDTATIALPSGLTKQLDSAWAAGTNAGGRSSASLADGTWHVFAIAKADGTSDVLFHTAVDPTSVLPSGYTVYRRIASIVRQSSTILAFTQSGDTFDLATPVLDVSANNPPDTAVARALSVPTGIVVTARIRAMLTNTDSNTATARGCIISPLASTDEAVSATNYDISPALNNAGGFSANNVMRMEIKTNTSGQIRTRNSNANSFVNLYIRTVGWSDLRGK